MGCGAIGVPDRVIDHLMLKFIKSVVGLKRIRVKRGTGLGQVSGLPF
jgi:hypothetical protein